MTPAHRIATEADLEQIVAIYNSTIPSRLSTADLEPVSVASRMPWFREHEPGTRPLWVVDGAAGIAGWLSFSSFHTRPAYRHTAELSVYVHAAARGRGIGSYLLEEALRAAPTLQIHTLLALIFDHNEPSLALFERHGFERWGLLPRVTVLDGTERGVAIVGRRVPVATEVSA